MQKSYFVHGPQGCGKTRDSKRIARALGMKRIVDDWMPGQPIPPIDTLILSQHEPPMVMTNRRVMSYEAAMRLVRTT